MDKLLATVFLLLPLAASAERADVLKPINIQYDKANVDQAAQNYVATGNVIITRGTLVLESDRAEVKESPDGYHMFILAAEPGNGRGTITLQPQRAPAPAAAPADRQ